MKTISKNIKKTNRKHCWKGNAKFYEFYLSLTQMYLAAYGCCILYIEYLAEKMRHFKGIIHTILNKKYNGIICWVREILCLQYNNNCNIQCK